MILTYTKTAEPTAAKRRLFFRLLTSAGVAVTGQVGTPQFSRDGAVFTSTGIGAATEVANGLYYADLDDAATEGMYVGYWKPGTTGDEHAMSLNAIQVGGNVGDALARMTNEFLVDKAARTVDIFDAGGVSGSNKLMTITIGSGGASKTKGTVA